MKKIGIIGGGNMGEAIIQGIHKQYSIAVSEKDKKRRDYLRRKYGIKSIEPKALAVASDIILLAVKPQDMGEVLKEIRPVVGKNTLVISIAAGITTSFIERRLGKNIRVIRTMPNMPAMIGEGVTALCGGRHAKKSDLQAAAQIFNNVGKTVVVSEDLIDAVTATSGSGPAYLFYFMESLIKGAQSIGLNESLAKELVLNTCRGSLNLLLKRKEDAAVFRQKVTSKGGTTQAALDVLMRHKFEKIISQAMAAAKKRAGELSQS